MHEHGFAGPAWGGMVEVGEAGAEGTARGEPGWQGTVRQLKNFFGSGDAVCVQMPGVSLVGLLMWLVSQLFRNSAMEIDCTPLPEARSC